MPKKYNPCLSSMVQNYRDKAKEVNLKTDHLTNEQVFDMIERNLGLTPEEDLEWFLEELKTNQPPT
jgi:hypothetical protein